MSTHEDFFCINEIVSPDTSTNLIDYSPIRSNCFSVTLQIIVGLKNQEGGEAFCLEVCTPQYIIENYNHEDMIWGRHLLIVFEWNFPKIRKKIYDYFSEINTDNWNDIVEKMSRIGFWEFEDYKPRT